MTLDPISYEVIKHRLWQINDEQGVTIRTISTSPIVVEGNDFNVGVFTHAGELVVAGPYITAHVTTMEAVIKSVIAGAGEVLDGDVFLVNDPYLGALHQNDIALVSPLFEGGEIVLWVGNVLHHADLGGPEEGSLCASATNVFQESPRYFLKLVAAGRLAREVERTVMMNSRLPDAVALDLRAQLSGVNVVKRRLRELLAVEGAERVLTATRMSLDGAERDLRRLLRRVPDGTWTAQAFMDGDRIGSERIQRVFVRLDKRGDELHFDYTGSDPQSEGPANATYEACYAGTVTPVFAFLCRGDIDWNSGIRRVVRVTAPEGTVMNARFPAAASLCSIGYSWLAAVVSMRALAQLFASCEELADRACAPWSVSSNANNLFGVGPDGRVVGGLLSDHRGTGAGARAFADGIDHAGTVFSYLSYMSNVESQEWKLPLLYVYRRRLADSGGPGRFRGGLTAVTALTPYGVERLMWKSLNTAGADQSNAAGIDGGYPGAGSQVSVVRGSAIWELMREGRPPLTAEEMGGRLEHLPSKSGGALLAGDVFVLQPPGGGGHGDPLERDPALVARDVREGAVSFAWAGRAYGVVLDAAGEVDAEATRGERRRRAEARLGGPAPRSFAAGGDAGGRPLSTCLAELDGAVVCRRCGQELGPAGGDPLAHGVRREAELAEAGPWLAQRWGGRSPSFALALTACPGCAALIDVEERLRDA
jgi:N-methylhydantoinase B